jgi:hypothetical protein
MFYDTKYLDLFKKSVDISKDDVEINNNDKTIKFLNPPPNLQYYKYIKNKCCDINNILTFTEDDKATFDKYLSEDEDLELYTINYIHPYSLEDALRLYSRYPDNYIFFILERFDLPNSELRLKIAVFLKWDHNDLDAVQKKYREIYADLYHTGVNIDEFQMTLEQIDNFRFMLIDTTIKTNSISVLDSCYNITSTIEISDINLIFKQE